MNPPDGEDPHEEYRGHSFWIEARRCGAGWSGHFRLLGTDPDQAGRAAAAGRHQWTTSMNAGWATPVEARRNATEAAHAAIDALGR